MSVTVRVQYFARLREERGCPEEKVRTEADRVDRLYEELAARHGLTLTREDLRVAVNDVFTSWGRELTDGDTVTFVPPVAGG